MTRGKWLKLLLILLTIFFSVPFVLDIALGFKKYKIQISASENKWIHRGLYDNKFVFENTMKAFDSARLAGFSGIELDVFFHDSLQDLVVTHDFPNQYNQPILLFSEVMKKYADSAFFWVDLKNLNATNQMQIANCFQKSISVENRKHIYIESGSANPLQYLASEGYNTIYWVQYNRTNFMKKYLKKNWIKYNLFNNMDCWFKIGLTKPLNQPATFDTSLATKTVYTGTWQVRWTF